MSNVSNSVCSQPMQPNPMQQPAPPPMPTTERRDNADL